MNQIMPIIASAIARGAVKPVRAEDAVELQADCCAQAARILDAAEAKGKKVTAGNVGYYALQAMKHGRRFSSASRTDALGSATALDGNAHVVSMDEPHASPEEPDTEMTLHDALADRRQGPDQAAGRELDWSAAHATLNDRERNVLQATAVGVQGAILAAELDVSRPRIVQIKREIGDRIKDAWQTDDPVRLVADDPAWCRHVAVARERRACRAERRG